MRKVIFEQTGNMILAILLVGAICQSLLMGNVEGNSSENFLFEVHFGWLWGIFLVFVALFSLTRILYARKLGKEDGYNKKDGELSAEDEREKLVSLKATAITYRVSRALWGSLLIVLFYGNSFLLSNIQIRLLGVVTMGCGFILTFLTYMVSWMMLDNKI